MQLCAITGVQDTPSPDDACNFASRFGVEASINLSAATCHLTQAAEQLMGAGEFLLTTLDNQRLRRHVAAAAAAAGKGTVADAMDATGTQQQRLDAVIAAEHHKLFDAYWAIAYKVMDTKASTSYIIAALLFIKMVPV